MDWMGSAGSFITDCYSMVVAGPGADGRVSFVAGIRRLLFQCPNWSAVLVHSSNDSFNCPVVSPF